MCLHARVLEQWWGKVSMVTDHACLLDSLFSQLKSQIEKQILFSCTNIKNMFLRHELFYTWFNIINNLRRFYVPSFIIPVAKHFWNRQNWHLLRRCLSTGQFLSARHTYFAPFWTVLCKFMRGIYRVLSNMLYQSNPCINCIYLFIDRCCMYLKVNIILRR